MNFKLHSNFEPSGDQAPAIEKLCDGLEKGYKDQTLLGVTGSGKTFTMANVIARVNKPTLVIAHNKTLAAQLASEFREFFPENAVHYFVSYYDYYQPEAYIPRSDTYIEKETSINDEIDRLRHAATHSLLTRKDVIIVASVSCIYGLGEPAEYLEQSFQFKIKQKISREEAIRKLVDILYERNDIEIGRGKFRVRGDILEIVPVYSEDVYRIGFFGNEIESIELVDGITGDSLEELDSVDIFPAKHFMTEGGKLKTAIKNIKQEMKDQVKKFEKEGKLIEAQRIEQRTNYDMEMLEEVGYVNGVENYSRHLSGRAAGQPPSTLIDFFPTSDVRDSRTSDVGEFDSGFLLFIDESHMTIPQIGGMYMGDRARKDTLIEYGFRLPSARDNRPLRFEEFEKKIGQTIYLSATPADFELKRSQNIVEQVIRPTGLIDPEIEVKPTENQVDDLIEQIRERTAKGQRVLVTTLTKKLSERLTTYLSELDIKVAYLHSDIDTLDRLDILRDLRAGVYDVLVGINLLREGLDLPEVSLVAILDADKEGFLRSATSLTQTIGRAARHVEGKVIMYADTITGSMKKAIDETNRRRAIQKEYNVKNKITPVSISKVVPDASDWREPVGAIHESPVHKDEMHDIPKDEVKRIIKELEKKMDIAARNLEFEKASEYRDQISELRKMSK
ncbi:MAG: excinuclease ABC subunit UvrB [Patescibacteria group bacterium]|nr:excinuclease ABC subunit UvrB [Patescibacteria group bacterium]